MPLYRGIVFVNCALGITSVAIQVKLLIPWHDVISHQVEQLESQQKRLEDRIGQLQNQLSATEDLSKAHQGKKSSWFW